MGIHSKHSIHSRHITDTKQHKTYHILNNIYYQDGEFVLIGNFCKAFSSTH